MIKHKISTFCAASSLAVLTACSAGQAPSSSAPSAAVTSSTGILISSAITGAMDKAYAKIDSGNITVSDHDDTGTPKAEITPQGYFLIDGKAVPLTPAQHQEMLAYRGQIVAIAHQGLAIGKQGAALGVSAAAVALAGAFSGESEQQIRQQVEAQTGGIREAAAKICDRLPALMTSQQKLAADVPAFRPYATMTQQDIDDCHRNALKKDDD